MAKGNYYKVKSKKFFENQGFKVEYLEKLQRIFNPKTKQTFFVKRDLFSSDLLMRNNEVIIFANVTDKHNVSSHIKRFQEEILPECEHIKQWVIYWNLRAKEPTIVEVEKNENNSKVK